MEPRIPGRALVALAAVIVVAGALAFGNAARNGVTNFDDHWQVRDNDILNAPLSLESVSAALFATYHGEYQPVKLLSYMADKAVYGALGVDGARGMHVTNIALHLLNALLAALIAVLAARDLAPEKFGVDGALFAGFFTGLYFVLHPVHVESVAWLSSRKDVLSFLLMALSLLSLRAYWRGAPGRAAVASVVLFALALGAKATVVALPILALVWWWLAGRPGGRRVWAPLAVLAALAAGAAAYMGVMAVRFGVMAPPLSGSYAIQFLTGVKTFPFYMKLLLFPTGLSAVYRLAPAGGLGDAAVWWGVAMLAAQASVALFARARMAKFIVLWYIAALLPVLQLVPGMQVPALAADRYAYAASVPFAMAPAVILYQVRCRLIARNAAALASLLMAAAVVYAGALGVSTWSRNRVWRSSDTLWTDVLVKDPKNVMALVNLGQARLEARDYSRARQFFTAAVRANRGYLIAWNNLGACDEAEGRIAEASACYNNALALPSGLTPAYTRVARAQAAYRLARIHFDASRYLTARRLAEQAAVTYPDIRGAASLAVEADAMIRHFKVLADDLVKIGDEAAASDPDRAARFYRRAAEAALEYRVPHERLASLHFRFGRWDEACEASRAAASYGANAPEFLYEYGTAALHMGLYSEAAEHLSRALAADPLMTRARVKLAVARAYLGQPAQALQMLQAVLDQDPSNSEARENFNAIKPVVEKRIEELANAAGK